MTEPRPCFIDSHCHIDSPDFDADRDAVVSRARAAGVESMLVVGGFDGAGSQRRALRVAETFGLPVSIGLHPHEARLSSDPIWDELCGLAREGRIVAIGEVGLDFHYEHSPRPAQREAFRKQVRLARELGLPLVVHSREADDETATILEEEAAGTTGVLHCFSSGSDLARRVVAMGFCISFSGIVAFPRAESVRQVARDIQIDRILVETDAPYLAPPPYRGRRNEPAFVVAVARCVAELRRIPASTLGNATGQNFRKLFRVSTSAHNQG